MRLLSQGQAYQIDVKDGQLRASVTIYSLVALGLRYYQMTYLYINNTAPVSDTEFRLVPVNVVPYSCSLPQL